ncbi:hypothetical protein U1Q18_051674 [Sarracenia purpurea var. burkii]
MHVNSVLHEYRSIECSLAAVHTEYTASLYFQRIFLLRTVDDIQKVMLTSSNSVSPSPGSFFESFVGLLISCKLPRSQLQFVCGIDFTGAVKVG